MNQILHSHLMYKICISGAAETGHCAENALELTKALGREIVTHNSVLITGATTGAPFWGAIGAKEAGGFVIGVSHKPHEVFDEYINVQDAGPATIIPNVVVAQLLAYYLTLARGLDPDMPRNLAKSVTVK